MEENAADYGIRAAIIGNADGDVPADIPNQVHAAGEAGNGSRIQHRASRNIFDSNDLIANRGVPIEEVKRKLMASPCGIDIHRE